MVTTTAYGAGQVARHTFERAYRRGWWRGLIATLFQRQVTLYGFDDVKRNVRISHSTDRGLREIPIAAIYGSVGRARDYTASFLPRKGHLVERWAQIYTAMEQMESLPPIEVYQVNERYYVIDGHHRVSVAKWLGNKEIAAHVIELQTHSLESV